MIVPLNKIILGLIEQGAILEEAIWFLSTQGFPKGQSLTIFHDFGVDFPIRHTNTFTDSKPSPERIKELQDLAASL